MLEIIRFGGGDEPMDLRLWAKRTLIYTLLSWPFITAIYLPYYLLVLRLSWAQIDLLLETGFWFSLVTSAAIGPYVRWVWRVVWRIEHHEPHPMRFSWS